MVKIPYLCKFFKTMWQCEHTTSTVTRALEGARASEGLWRFFISFTVNPPLTMAATNLWAAGNLSEFQQSVFHTGTSHEPYFIRSSLKSVWAWHKSKERDNDQQRPAVTDRCGRVSGILLRVFRYNPGYPDGDVSWFSSGPHCKYQPSTSN
jgi:hypothetical protein